LRSREDLAYSFHGEGLLVDGFSNYNRIRSLSPFLSFQGFWNSLSYENLKDEDKDKLLIIEEKLLSIKSLAQNENKS
jgi:hypothetical protein